MLLVLNDLINEDDNDTNNNNNNNNQWINQWMWITNYISSYAWTPNHHHYYYYHIIIYIWKNHNNNNNHLSLILLLFFVYITLLLLLLLLNKHGHGHTITNFWMFHWWMFHSVSTFSPRSPPVTIRSFIRWFMWTVLSLFACLFYPSIIIIIHKYLFIKQQKCKGFINKLTYTHTILILYIYTCTLHYIDQVWLLWSFSFSFFLSPLQTTTIVVIVEAWWQKKNILHKNILLTTETIITEIIVPIARTYMLSTLISVVQ